MINDIHECKSAKKWALGFYIVFMLNLILAGVMLGIADFAKWNLIMFFAGVFIACSIVSLVVFCALLHEVNTWVKFQKTYYVDINKIYYLVNHLGFRDECDHLERTCLHNGRAYVLSVDTTNGLISCQLDDVEICDCWFAITDLAKLNILGVLQPVV